MFSNLRQFFSPEKVKFAEEPKNEPDTPHEEFLFSGDLEEDEVHFNMMGSRDNTNNAREYHAISEEVKSLVSLTHQKIDGFKFDISLGLSDFFLVSCEWHLSPPTMPSGDQMEMMQAQMGGGNKSSFQLNAQYVHFNFERPKFPLVFAAQYMSNGSLTASINKPIYSWLNLMLQMSFPASPQIPRQQILMLNLPLGQSQYHFRIGNFEKNFSFVQSVGRSTQLGVSITNKAAGPQGDTNSIGVIGRTAWRNKTFIASYETASDALDMGMIQKLGKDTTIATHFSKSLNPMAMQMGRGSSYDCVATLGYRKLFPSYIVRGALNTLGLLRSSIGTSIGGKMSPPIKFEFYGQGNIFKDDYKFGYSLKLQS